MRGLGLSRCKIDPGRDISLDLLVEDLLAILDHAGAQSVHFCGESMGGILGLALAARYADRIRTLTLVSTAVFIEQQMKERYSLGRGSRIEAMQEMGIREWVAATTRGTRLPADTEPNLFEWYVDGFCKGDSEIQIAMSRIVNDANPQGFLADIACPVLGLYPTGGQITSSNQEQLLRDGLKSFDLRYLPTGYHMVQLLYPKTCAETLIAFCARHDGTFVIDR